LRTEQANWVQLAQVTWMGSAPGETSLACCLLPLRLHRPRQVFQGTVKVRAVRRATRRPPPRPCEHARENDDHYHGESAVGVEIIAMR
jgi:hypothetical protein